MSDGFLWRDAEVTYPDWNGTAQLDERQTATEVGGYLTPEQRVGLDPDEWTIVGLDIGGGEHGHELRVVAVHRDLIPEGGDVFPKVADANNGQIPATEFLIHDVDPYEFLRSIAHMFELRMRVQGTRDLPIRIVAQADVPEQS